MRSEVMSDTYCECYRIEFFKTCVGFVAKIFWCFCEQWNFDGACKSCGALFCTQNLVFNEKKLFIF